MNAEARISLSWREGRYFDLWMLVHVCGGLTGGFSNVLFGLSTRDVYLVGVALMVLWEIAEYANGVRESAANRVLDVVVGLVGVAAALWITARLDSSGRYIALVLSGVAFGGGSFLGWLAFRRRTRAEG